MAQKVSIKTIQTVSRVRKTAPKQRKISIPKTTHSCPYCGGDGIIGNGRRRKEK